ncbi:unnamed protein product [Rotaria sp. Silwood1]|nr:unnamed protein product [Rotaria sp. Silwood1]CAF1613647.1 unnamed protein product [Rotaria sp. Silwood1]CAF3697502.1 unnamed protein product [Rotaria sp. Silwood1]CAF3698924.1 unnamed protein product [Rotaria sp. Silwood1]CAF3733983.1 unnamed protein product [Rotaria sp. Silwood1]
MAVDFENSSSTPEKLALLVFIAAIVVGNICVFVTYFVRANGKHWSNMYVLGMAFIDLFIGSFVLPMRFISAYGSPLTSKLCAALSIGESCALASVIYAIGFMVYTRLYDLKKTSLNIRRRHLIILLLLSWIVLFLFYGVPFMSNYSSYLLTVTSSTTNITSYCTTYTTSIYHPTWMAYTEIGIIYSLPFLCIFIGLIFLISHLCQPRPIRLDKIQRKQYREQKQMTRHVVILSITFLVLWLPWITIRILIIFHNTKEIQRALQITYYILILKSVVFPILYASTNSSFRGSFAIYRHKRITTNNRVWTVREHFGY